MTPHNQIVFICLHNNITIYRAIIYDYNQNTADMHVLCITIVVPNTVQGVPYYTNTTKMSDNNILAVVYHNMK